MKKLDVAVVVAAALFANEFTLAAQAAEFDFRPVLPAVDVPANVTLGAVSGVGVDSQGLIYVLQRANPPVLCFNPTGKFLRAFGGDLIGTGHGLTIDPEDNVWVTDTGHHLVFKFSPEGKLLLALGQSDRPGTGENQFDKPTYAAFGPGGDIFIMDGYGNARIVRYRADGRFVHTWGRAGQGAGEFNAPHAAVVDEQGRLIVCDRDNDRIQIFDREGKLLDTWTGYTPFGIARDAEGTIFICDAKRQQVLQLDEKGKVTRSWGKEGTGPGEFKTPHLMTADREGNLYIAEVSGKRLQKLQRVR